MIFEASFEILKDFLAKLFLTTDSQYMGSRESHYFQPAFIREEGKDARKTNFMREPSNSIITCAQILLP